MPACKLRTRLWSSRTKRNLHPESSNSPISEGWPTVPAFSHTARRSWFSRSGLLVGTLARPHGQQFSRRRFGKPVLSGTATVLAFPVSKLGFGQPVRHG